MKSKIMPNSIITIISFFLINWGLWEILVVQGVDKSWASFTVYAVLIVIVILIWYKELLAEWLRLKEEIKSWKNFFIELLVWLAIAILLAYVFQYIINGAFITENSETVGEMVDKIPPILSCVMMSVFTPFIEEL